MESQPLEALIPPASYHDPQVFAEERERLFSRTWIFAGLSGEIAAPNDYFRCDIAGRDVIVQNCGGGLRAFVNSCSHRHSRIHEEERGNRKLICPYHGWAYDDEGIPAGIPKRENFPQVCASPGSYGLRRLELDRAGQFIFLRLQGGGPSLREFLAGSWQFLEQVSSGMDARMDEFKGTLRANWKNVIENALEGYHVPLVHRDTLGAIRQFSQQSQDIVDHLPPSGHSFMVNKASEEWLARWKRFERPLGTWPFKFDHYVHQLIYPNLTVTSFMGYSFHIQRFNPNDVGATTVDSRIYSSRYSGQTEEGARVMQSVYKEGLTFTRSVFAEDQRACEMTWQGLHHAGRPALLANHLEKRIAHFQASYLRSMGG